MTEIYSLRRKGGHSELERLCRNIEKTESRERGNRHLLGISRWRVVCRRRMYCEHKYSDGGCSKELDLCF